MLECVIVLDHNVFLYFKSPLFVSKSKISRRTIFLSWHQWHFFTCYYFFVIMDSDWHDLVRIKVGMAVSHDQHSYEVINWKVIRIILGIKSIFGLLLVLSSFSGQHVKKKEVT